VPLAVEGPADLADLLQRAAGFPTSWIALPGGADLVASGLGEALARGQGPVLVLVGPEGGFDPIEIERSISAGFAPVGFPTPILRAPTAVAYLAALAPLAGSSASR